MADYDDFTFCQVGASNAEDCTQKQKVVQSISEITIEDESSKNDDKIQGKGVTWSDKLQVNATLQKQEKVGSLSFTVIDASASKNVTRNPTRESTEVVGSSVKPSQEKKIPTRKPLPRTKVPFEKGYSQLDWMRLTQTHPDLAGLKGKSNKRLISLDEVKQHQNEDSMWTVLKGRVYNIAPYMKFHPGGADMLMKAVGRDCTSLFNKYHAWVNADILLEKCLVGTFEDNR